MSSYFKNGRLPFSKLEYLIAWLYRESICIYLFLKASIDPTVKWRNGRYRLRYGGLAEEIIESNKQPGSSSIQNSLQDVEKNANTTQNNSLNSIDSTSRKNLNLASFNSIYTSSHQKSPTSLNQSHKRTNSHTLNLNYNNNSASQSSLGHTGSGSNSDLHKANNSNGPIRSHHVHHHSISNPIHQSNSTAALIDLTISPLAKSPDKELDKIV